MPTDATIIRRSSRKHAVRCALLAQSLLSTAAGAQVTHDSTIMASAHDTWRLPPDRATFYVVVDDTGQTGTEAMARVEARVSRVMQRLSPLKRPLRLTTERPRLIAVGTNYRKSFVARTVIKTRLGRVDSLSQVFAAVLEAGGRITTISFELEAADSVRLAGLPGLIAAATANAEKIAESLGGRLGVLIEVETRSGDGSVTVMRDGFDTGFERASPNPEVTVFGSVSVRYRLVPP
jgi:uncharacterized protein YggE